MIADGVAGLAAHTHSGDGAREEGERTDKLMMHRYTRYEVQLQSIKCSHFVSVVQLLLYESVCIPHCTHCRETELELNVE